MPVEELKEITAKTGSEPGSETKGPDSSTGKTGEEGGVSPSPEDENLPWHKDPRFQKFNEERKELKESNEKIKAIMKANDLDSMDDLIDLVDSGKKVIGKINDLENIDELIEKAQKLDQWTEYYARQAEIAKEEVETSEETIARLKAELVKKNHREAQDSAARESEALLKGYYKTVEATVDEVLKDLPESQKAFITEFFGVDNPFAVIDIADKRAVKKMVVDGKKKLESFKTQVIKDYIAGKEKIPHVTSTGESTTTAQPRITLKTARAALHERWKPF